MPHKEPTTQTLDDVCRLLAETNKTLKNLFGFLIGFFIASAAAGWGIYVAW